LAAKATSTMFSAVIITKNEAATIADVLRPLVALTDDIVVIDSQSTDGTIEICEANGARVIQQEWLGFSATKNFGHSQAKYDWILSIDADEVLSDELIASLKKVKLQANTVYSLDRITDLYGTWVRHSGWYPDWKIRLFQRDSVYWKGDFVHETLHVPSDFSVVKLEGKFYHYSYKNAEDHIQRIDKYAALAAAELHEKGKKATWIKLYLAPISRFVKTLIFQGGILDGKAGWTIARRNAYLVRRKYGILRELSQE